MPVGPKSLWPENTVEIAIQLPHIDGHVGYGLGAVEHDGDALSVGQLDNTLDRQDGAEGVGDLSDGDELGAG